MLSSPSVALTLLELLGGCLKSWQKFGRIAMLLEIEEQPVVQARQTGNMFWVSKRPLCV
jgi:hypothetical protein